MLFCFAPQAATAGDSAQQPYQVEAAKDIATTNADSISAHFARKMNSILLVDTVEYKTYPFMSNAASANIDNFALAKNQDWGLQHQRMSATKSIQRLAKIPWPN